MFTFLPPHSCRILTKVALVAALAGTVAVSSRPAQAQDAGAKRNNLVYEIFVRSFCDGKPAANGQPDGIGDLPGITRQLSPYLNDGNPLTTHDLGVGILWLMPIFPSSSYHGYDVDNYRAVNPQYGSLADLRTLVQAAHARGVRVILDIPFNHTSTKHPWFQEALANPASPKRNYYIFRPAAGLNPDFWHSAPSLGALRYQGVFGHGMPDLNIANPQVQQEIFQIAKFWLSQGVDGFRLDAAKHLYGDSNADPNNLEIQRNNDFWRAFSDSVYRLKPDAVLVGEVLGNREMLRRHSWGLDALVDEPFMDEVRKHVAQPSPGLLNGQKFAQRAASDLNASAYSGAAPYSNIPFHFFPYLASHDKSPRLRSEFELRKSQGMTKSVDQAYRLASYLLFTTGRYPIIYNGDELMQGGFKWNGNPPQNGGDGSGIYDETLREPFPWYKSGNGLGQTKWFLSKYDRPNDGVSREEQSLPAGMLPLWRGLSGLRQRHPDLANGEIGAILNDDNQWWVFEKIQGPKPYLVLINQTGNGADYKFANNWYPQYRSSRLLFWGDGGTKQWKDLGASMTRIQDKVFVPPYGMVVLQQ